MIGPRDCVDPVNRAGVSIGPRSSWQEEVHKYSSFQKSTNRQLEVSLIIERSQHEQGKWIIQADNLGQEVPDAGGA